MAFVGPPGALVAPANAPASIGLGKVAESLVFARVWRQAVPGASERKRELLA